MNINIQMQDHAVFFMHSFLICEGRYFTMEGLMSAQIKVRTVHSFCSWQHNSIQHIPLLAPRVTRRVLISPMESQRSLKTIAASVQPAEASEAGRFNNTLPSKGTTSAFQRSHFYLLCSSCIYMTIIQI